MPSVNIQFHMLFEELIAFVADVSSRHHLGVELERYYPKAVLGLPSGASLGEEIRRFGPVDRFWLLCQTARSKKPERFMLNFGGQRGNRLAQSQLGAGTRKVQAYHVLKQVAADLRRRTAAGMWVITEMGYVGYSKKARVSVEATNAWRSGTVELVSSAFTQSFRVDPPGSGEA